LFEFIDVEVERCETVEVFLGVADDEFEGPDFMITVSLIIADSADDALVDALGLEANEVENLPGMEVSPGALRVVELVAAHTIPILILLKASITI